MGNLVFRDLTSEDVEVRVQSCKENGVSLLIYKDARVDQAILDETVGPTKWKKSYREIKGNLFCTISIWDPELGEWVSKEDCGVESNTEKEKGEASDAQKRSGFAWGIGRELYSAPFIWISKPVEGKPSPFDYANLKISKTQNGYRCDTYFSVSKMTVKEKKITELEIIDSKTGEVCFSYPRKKQTQTTIEVVTETSKAKVNVTKATTTKAVDTATAKPSKEEILKKALKVEYTDSKNEVLPLGDSIKECVTKEKQDEFFKHLKSYINEKKTNWEACLIVYQGLTRTPKLISFPA